MVVIGIIIVVMRRLIGIKGIIFLCYEKMNEGDEKMIECKVCEMIEEVVGEDEVWYECIVCGRKFDKEELRELMRDED